MPGDYSEPADELIALDGEVDGEEVGELLTESYCLFAPKKLVALVDRQPEPD